MKNFPALNMMDNAIKYGQDLILAIRTRVPLISIIHPWALMEGGA